VATVATLLIADSQFGNTAQIAQVVATTLQAAGPVRLFAAKNITAVDASNTDLVVVGGPTQHRVVWSSTQSSCSARAMS